MAINVRYDNAGDIASLATTAGKAEDFWRRHAAEQSLVQAARQEYARQDAQRLEAERLNVQRQALQQQAFGGQSNTNAQVVRGPFAQSVTDAATLARKQKLATLTPGSKEAFALLAEDPSISTGELYEEQRRMAPKFTPEQTRLSLAQKQAALESVRKSLDDDSVGVLQAVANDPGTTITDFTNALQRQQSEKRQRQSQDRLLAAEEARADRYEKTEDRRSKASQQEQDRAALKVEQEKIRFEVEQLKDQRNALAKEKLAGVKRDRGAQLDAQITALDNQIKGLTKKFGSISVGLASDEDKTLMNAIKGLADKIGQ